MTGTRFAVAPIELIINEVTNKVWIILKRLDLRLNRSLSNRSPLTRIESLCARLHPRGNIQIAGDGDIELMEDWITPGAQTFKSGIEHPSGRAFSPGIQIAVAAGLAVPVM